MGIIRTTVIALAMAIMAAPAMADMAKAKRLYEAGQHNQAFAEFLPLARGDIPEAQDMVGMMYMLGVGTEQNYALGALWLSLAAHNGIDQAAETRDTLITEFYQDILKNLRTLSP